MYDEYAPLNAKIIVLLILMLCVRFNLIIFSKYKRQNGKSLFTFRCEQFIRKRYFDLNFHDS